MKVYYSPYSPFVRKVLICAAELGVELEKLPCAAHPIDRDRHIVKDNPLGQVPTLFTDEGQALFDSAVICEYLDSNADGSLIPRDGATRWQRLVEQALADGALNACLLMRYEQVIRPETLRLDTWFNAQREKVSDALDRFEQWSATFAERVDIGTIAIACVLGYLDLRFAEEPWRERAPTLAAWYQHFGQRPSMQSTRHPV